MTERKRKQVKYIITTNATQRAVSAISILKVCMISLQIDYIHTHYQMK